MTDSEKMDLILLGMQDIKSEIQDIKSEMQELRRRETNIELTLENETNRNIQLLAENHITLIDKLKIAQTNISQKGVEFSLCTFYNGNGRMAIDTMMLLVQKGIFIWTI